MGELLNQPSIRAGTPPIVRFDAFLSYSHAADGLLAPRLQTGLQSFAKPWWKRRMLRVFRDEASLSANPHLWSSITSALDSAGWFIPLLSPAAAGSEWVNREVEYWLTNKDPNRILPVLTEGTFSWDQTAARLDPSSSVPPALLAGFSEEPRWVDLRWAREDTQLDLRNSRFRGAVADIASAVRGIPKDDLESEEVRQHRRTVRTAWGAGVALAVLTVAASGAAVYANDQRNEADTQRGFAENERIRAEQEAERALSAESLARSRELAASAINVLDDDPELSILLALEAIDQAPAGAEIPIEAQSALREAAHGSLIRRREVVSPSGGWLNLAVSPDGSQLVVSSELGGFARAVETETWDVLWEYGDESIDTFLTVAYSPDGQTVAMSIADSTAEFASYQPGPDDAVDDDLPARVVLLDASTGEPRRILEFPECPYPAMSQQAFSPDGRWLAIGSSGDGICGPTTEDWAVELIDPETLETDHRLAGPHFPMVSWSADGSRLAIAEGFFEDIAVTTVYETGDLTPLVELPGILAGTIAPAGDRLAGLGANRTVVIVDLSSGAPIDQLAGLTDFAASLTWAENGNRLIAGSDGPMAVVWDVSSSEVAYRLTTAGTIASMAYDSNQGLLHYANIDGKVTVWDLSGAGEGESATVQMNRFVQANSIAVAGDGGAFFGIDLTTGAWEVWTFDTATAGLGERLPVAPHKRPSPLPDGRVAVALGREGESGPLVVWDPGTGEQVELAGCWIDPFEVGPSGEPAPCQDREGTFAGLSQVFLSPTEDSLLARMADGTTQVFDLGSLAETARYDIDFDLEVFGDPWAVAYLTGNAFRLIDVTTGIALADDFESSCPFVIWDLSPDGRYLGTATQCGEVTVIDTSSWEIVTSFQAHDARVRGLAFSESGDMLMTGATDGYVKVWEIPEGQEHARIPLTGASDGHWLDDQHLVVGTSEGLWTTITLDLNELKELAESRLTRVLSETDCAVYRVEGCS